MDTLKEKFAKKTTAEAENVKQFISQSGDAVIGEYTVAQVYQGMRGMTGLVTETSKLDPEEGIRFRGYSIPELRDKLPKAPGGRQRAGQLFRPGARASPARRAAARRSPSSAAPSRGRRARGGCRPLARPTP